MQENSSRTRSVELTASEFSYLLRRAAEPACPGELVTHAINRVARRLGISRRTARAYWYGERRHVPADLMDRARALAGTISPPKSGDRLSDLQARVTRLEKLLFSASGQSEAIEHLISSPSNTEP